jgi:hypothetical protein
MTAEIVIMNQQAIALAADSAVTARKGIDQKIFSSANKLFALSKNHNIGVMIYGNNSFMNIPWETLIKIYREKSQNKKFDTISNCVEDLLLFLGECNKLISPSTEERIYKEAVSSYFGFVKNTCLIKLKAYIDEKGKASENEIEGVINNTIENITALFKGVQDSPCVKGEFREYIHKKYGTITNELMKVIFEKLPISKESVDKLTLISIDLCCKFAKGLNSPLESGIVIAGFGEGEIFPALKSFVVEFAFNGVVKYKWDKEKKIGDNMRASIVPFAQSDAVATFMDGIDPERQKIEIGFLEQLFREYQVGILTGIEEINEEQKKKLEEKLKSLGAKKLTEHWQKLNVFTKTRYNQPVMNVIRMLPKDELAMVAETFINLTSFKKRVTMESETVGGPIDVAVISKGDGFIWIKRKHYFKQELNPQFFSRYMEG